MSEPSFCRWYSTPFAAIVVGVCHCCEARLIAGRVAAFSDGDRFTPAYIAASGVGHDEDAFTLMRSANGRRSKHSPFRSEPERGKVPENSSHCSPNNAFWTLHNLPLRHTAIGCCSAVSASTGEQPWDVFEHDESRSHLANDPNDVGPYPSFVLESFALAGDAVRLAGESGSDAIHSAAPRSAIKREKVRPDRRRRNALRFHERDKLSGGRSFPLNVTNGSIVEPM